MMSFRTCELESTRPPEWRGTVQSHADAAPPPFPRAAPLRRAGGVLLRRDDRRTTAARRAAPPQSTAAPRARRIHRHLFPARLSESGKREAGCGRARRVGLSVLLARCVSGISRV